VCQSKVKPVKQIQETNEEVQQECYKFDSLVYKLDAIEKRVDEKPSSSGRSYDTNVKVQIAGTKTKVQVDSGADVNVMDKATYQKIANALKINQNLSKAQAL